MENDYVKGRLSINIPQSPVLRDHLKGKIVLPRVGNRIRGDDAGGPELIKVLKGRPPDRERS
jgi:hypothetical protein